MEGEGKSARLGTSGQSGDDDEGQGDHTSTWRLVRLTQNPEVERSQKRRPEKAQNSDSWKQFNQEESTNSVNTRRLVRAATPRTDFQNMKHTNHQYMTKNFQISQKNLGIQTKIFNILNGTINNKCVDMGNVHVFVNESSHPSLDRIIWRTWKSTRTRTSMKWDVLFFGYNFFLDTKGFLLDANNWLLTFSEVRGELINCKNYF